jgi:imidazolonepropionase-like amidohydrolase
MIRPSFRHPLRAGALLLALLTAGPAFAGEDRSYTVLLMGNEAGLQRVQTAGQSVRVEFRFDDRGRGPDTVSEFRLDDAGLPTAVRVSGVDYFKAPVAESFDRAGKTARWKSAADEGETAGGGFYLPLDGPPATLAVLARALMEADDERLELLPTGEAWFEVVGELEVAGGRTIRQAEIHGLGFEPQPVWLNPDGSLYAVVDSWLSVIERGRTGDAEMLLAQQDARREARFAAMAQRSRTPAAGRVLIDDARIIDVRHGRVRPENAVLTEGGRIVALLSPGDERPRDATTVDADGRTLLPGLWDMHGHLDLIAGPLNVANGVTTVRDLANDHERLAGIMRQIRAGAAVGTAIFRAGIIDGGGEFAGPTKARVATPGEAEEWIDFYAGQGYQQIKIYSSVPVALVPGMAQYAHAKGLRVSGHVPAGMWAEDAVRAGYDEIQHINMLFLNFYKDVTETRNMDRFLKPAERGGDLDLDGDDFRAFVELLAANDTVVDPTVAIFFDMLTQRPGQPKPTEAAIYRRLPARIARESLKGGFAVPDEDRPRYDASVERMLDVVRALHEAGIRLVAGTDAMPGFALHSELELYVRAGLPPMDVLRIATLGSAQVMGVDTTVGAIEPGLAADLILIDGRPDERMSEIRNVDWVMRDGAIYDPQQLLLSIGVAPRTDADRVVVH